MEEQDHLLDILHTPRFRSYFLKLLASPMSAEEKYHQMLAFLGYPGEDFMAPQEQQPLPGVDISSGLAGHFNYAAFYESVNAAGSVLRAVKRLGRSQHKDGGWGAVVEQSNLWQTVYSLLALRTARRCEELIGEYEVTPLMSRGYAYVEQQSNAWAADCIEPEGKLSVYDLSLVVRCFFLGGREFMRRETAVRIYRSLEHLHRAQNADGGWDAFLWGYAVMAPSRLFSEVGSTSAALQALAFMRDDRFMPVVQKGVEWLAATQNLDGSWNNGSARPDLPPLTLTGDPRVGKTCDAIQGILTLQQFDLPLRPYLDTIRRALDWLWNRQQPVLTKPHNRHGWGWGYSREDYEDICLSLETLLALPEPLMTQIAAYALWLIESQRKQEDDPEDGSWVSGPTARITAALAEYYRSLRGPMLDNRWIP